MTLSASNLTPVASATLGEIAARYPNLPAEYLEFLGRYGWGALGMADAPSFMVYSGPVPAAEIYGEDALNLMIIGDDMSGYCLAVDVSDGGLIELDPNGQAFPVEEGLAHYLSRLGVIIDG